MRNIKKTVTFLLKNSINLLKIGIVNLQMIVWVKLIKINTYFQFLKEFSAKQELKYFINFKKG